MYDHRDELKGGMWVGGGAGQRGIKGGNGTTIIT